MKVIQLNLFCLLIDHCQGYFLAMISERQVYVASPGESVLLECSFHADQYNMFEHPVLWRKEQQQEDMQINVLSNINEPFIKTNRYEVVLKTAEPRYQLELLITDVSVEDSGNYTCEVRGAHSIVIVSVTHLLFIRESIDSVTLSSDREAKFGQKSTSVIHLVEGQRSPIHCSTLGGSPPPSTQIFIDKRDISAQFLHSVNVDLTGHKGLRRLYYRTDRWTTDFMASDTDDRLSLKCITVVPGLNPIVEVARLDVDYSPKLSCRSVEAAVGDMNVLLTCEVKAKPKVNSIQWILFNNGTAIKPGDVLEDYSAIVKERKDGLTEVQLLIRRARVDKFRRYSMVAENQVAISRAEVELVQFVRSAAKQPLSDAASDYPAKQQDPGPHRSTRYRRLQAPSTSPTPRKLFSSSSSHIYAHPILLTGVALLELFFVIHLSTFMSSRPDRPQSPSILPARTKPRPCCRRGSDPSPESTAPFHDFPPSNKSKLRPM